MIDLNDIATLGLTSFSDINELAEKAVELILEG